MKGLRLGVALLFSATAASLAAQATADADPGKPVTMNGCVARRVAPQDPLTFQDDRGFKYRITGRGLGRYTGQRVEISGTSPVPKRFSFKFGLYPSPNVAARAGDLDPAREAIARQPGGSESGTGTVELLPEFRVTRVRVVEGGCG